MHSTSIFFLLISDLPQYFNLVKRRSVCLCFSLSPLLLRSMNECFAISSLERLVTEGHVKAFLSLSFTSFLIRSELFRFCRTSFHLTILKTMLWKDACFFPPEYKKETRVSCRTDRFCIVGSARSVWIHESSNCPFSF